MLHMSLLPAAISSLERLPLLEESQQREVLGGEQRHAPGCRSSAIFMARALALPVGPGALLSGVV